MSASQVDQIREALLRGEELTPIEALRRFGCLRLAARVSDLRRDGLQIESETVEALVVVTMAAIAAATVLGAIALVLLWIKSLIE